MWHPDRCPLEEEFSVLDFGLHPNILAISNTYMNMFTRLYRIVGHKTDVMETGQAPKQTQKWHRDPDDKKLCKVFVYLNDVDENSFDLEENFERKRC